jgi:hypothetical protein
MSKSCQDKYKSEKSACVVEETDKINYDYEVQGLGRYAFILYQVWLGKSGAKNRLYECRTPLRAALENSDI